MYLLLSLLLIGGGLDNFMTQKMVNSKKENEMSFEEKLWETAEQLRGKVEVSSYKIIAVGLMFLKFISERYNFRRNELEQETRRS